MSDNQISVSSSPLSINGQPLGGGFSFAYDLGGSTNDYANSAYAFLNQNQVQNQSFLGRSIMGTQGFLSHQLSPLSGAIADTQKQNAAMMPLMTKGISDNSQFLANSMSGLVAQGYQTIQNNTFNTNSSSTQVASSGGGSYVCTAMYDVNLITPADYEKLNVLKDVYMMSQRDLRRSLMEYYKRAPALVAKLKESECYVETLTELKRCFIEPVLRLIDTGFKHEAYLKYKEMMFVILALTKDEVSA